MRHKNGRFKMMKLLSALLLATAAAEDFSNDAAASSDGGHGVAGGSYADSNGDEDVVQEFLPKMSFSAKDYFKEKEAKGACLLLLGWALMHAYDNVYVGCVAAVGLGLH
jgi:hypothetical protein